MIQKTSPSASAALTEAFDVAARTVPTLPVILYGERETIVQWALAAVTIRAISDCNHVARI
jgi:hypothetical protein